MQASRNNTALIIIQLHYCHLFNSLPSNNAQEQNHQNHQSFKGMFFSARDKSYKNNQVLQVCNEC